MKRKPLLYGLATVSLLAGSLNLNHSTVWSQEAYGQGITVKTTQEEAPIQDENPIHEAPLDKQSLVDKVASHISEEVAEVPAYHDGTPTPETPLVYVFPDLHATVVHHLHTLSIDKLQKDLGLRLIGMEGDRSTRITSASLSRKLAAIQDLQARGDVYQLRKNEENATGRKSKPITSLKELIQADPLLKYTQDDDAELFGLEEPRTSKRLDVIEKIQKAYTLYFEAMHRRKKIKTGEGWQTDYSQQGALPPLLNAAEVKRFESIFSQFLSELPAQALPPLSHDIARCYVSPEEWKILQDYEKDLKKINRSPSQIKESLLEAYGDNPYLSYLRFPEEAPTDHQLPDFNQGFAQEVTVFSTPFWKAADCLKKRYVNDIRTTDAVSLAISKTTARGKKQVAIVFGEAHLKHIQYELENRGCPYIVMGKPNR